MPISIPVKMSQFETVSSLSTASFVIGLDVYSGTLANVKISGSDAGYDLARKRWILPVVTSSSDPRGSDGAESYGPDGRHWVKSGSIWVEIANLVNSASYALKAESLLPGININVTQVTASSIVVSNLYVHTVTSSVELITGSLTVLGPLTAFGGLTGSHLGTSSWANNAITSSYAHNATTASYSHNATTSSYALVSTTASYAIDATTSSYAISALTASYALMSGGVISSSYQLSDGGGQAFNSSNNVTFGNVAASALSVASTAKAESLVIGSTGTSSFNNDVYFNSYRTYFKGAYTFIQATSIGDGIFFTGSYDTFGSIYRTTGRFNIYAGPEATIGMAFGTATSGRVIEITQSGSVSISKKLGIGSGKNSIVNSELDVNGNGIITGSLIVTGAITSSLLGTASYALNARSNNVFNVKDYGAVGDGTTNDTVAIMSAISASQAAGIGTVYFPDGIFSITSSLTLPVNPQCDITILGDGSNVSIIKQTSNVHGIEFDMNNGGVDDQQYQVAIRGIGLRTSGQASASIYVTYGTSSISAHQNISVDLNDVHVFSDNTNYWSRGIVLESAWNFRISDCMVVGRPLGTSDYEGVGLEVRRMCVNGSINQSQFNFWNTGIHVNTVDYTSDGMNTEGLFMSGLYMVPVNYGIYVKGNKSFFTSPFNSYDWANRPIAGRMVLLGLDSSHIDSRNSGSALLLENVQSHYITSNLMISDGTGSVIYGLNAHEGTITGNTLFNAGYSPSIYIGGYSGSANIITGNIFRGGSTHVLLESSSLYNKVYGNVAYDALNITVIDSGSYNLTGSVGN